MSRGRMGAGGMKGRKKGKVFEGGKFSRERRVLDYWLRNLLIIDKNFKL